ncbi:MAG: hypothetical protein JKY45_00125 [Emcibacter sp.]|nr:hypothetical protein [Emcibacter sp.]
MIPRIFIVFLLGLCPFISSYAAEMSVIAGNGEAGFKDGKEARFNKPIRLSPFGPGRILVADIGNHAIRIVSKDGTVTTIAGGPDKQGHKDGPAKDAMFNGPHGVAVSPEGIIAVAGASSHVIRLITPTDHGYMVSTIAGVEGETGLRNGPAKQALFNSPHGLSWDDQGGLLIVDIGNSAIRRIKDGVVTTVLTSDVPEMAMPIDIAPAAKGAFLIADAGNNTALRWHPNGPIEIIATDKPLKVPHGVAQGLNGAVYVAEIGHHQISRLKNGHKTSVAGTGTAGKATNQLNKPAAVLVHDGILWIADLSNHRIAIVPLTEE